MRRGTWHQCGDRSQNIAAEMLQRGIGAGVVISARDLKFENAIKRAEEYHDLGASVVIDQQFYVPDSDVGKLDSYPINEHRAAISALHSLPDEDLGKFASNLLEINQKLDAEAIIAPAVIYQAGRVEIHELNERLFSAARTVGDTLGKPVYATVVLGQSAAATMDTINNALAHATSLAAEGWYFACEFAPERIPSPKDAVKRALCAMLTLACTGKPLFHAYAGPMGLLSMGCGATAVGVGHSQNLWKFDRARWEPAEGTGGGGDAPARYFSKALWGTIIMPDEMVQLTPALRKKVFEESPYTSVWDRWEAGKHMVYLLGSAFKEIAKETNAAVNAEKAVALLSNAVAIFDEIESIPVNLKDDTSAYQQNWIDALAEIVVERKDDYDMLDMLS